LVDCEAPEYNGVHPFYVELTDCLDETDNYFYSSVTYKANKKENIITASVQGKSIFNLK
jgi:GTP1/Obg family GTP-binding protein